MKKIQLTQGQVASVNDEDFGYLNQWKWFALKDKNIFYAVRQASQAIYGKQFTIRMHHVIIGKPPEGYETDHRDGNGCNNQRKNLRFVTRRQNQQNRKYQNSSSRYPGVCWYKRDRKWQAEIRVDNKYKYLGRFATELEAFNAYKQAVKAIGETII